MAKNSQTTTGTRNIPGQQNNPSETNKLAAQRQLYCDAKKLQLWQFYLSLPAAIIWPIVLAIFPNISAYAALWGITVMVIENFGLTPAVQKRRFLAAQIQESFDCRVLNLEWQTLHVGKEPSEESILEASARFEKHHQKKELINWYPTSVSAIPPHLARIICQRSSCWWDGELRQRYSQLLIISLIVLTILCVFIGITAEFTVSQLVAVLMSLLPVYTFFGKQIQENISSATSMDNLRDHAQKIWKSALSQSDVSKIEEGSRDLQREIFSHRKSAPLIPEWIYNLLRSKHEDTMNTTAKELMDEAKISSYE